MKPFPATSAFFEVFQFSLADAPPEVAFSIAQRVRPISRDVIESSRNDSTSAGVNRRTPGIADPCPRVDFVDRESSAGAARAAQTQTEFGSTARDLLPLSAFATPSAEQHHGTH